MVFIQINSFLLSFFAKDVKLGSDVKSLSHRYQILSIIYINIILSSMALGYELSVGLSFQIPGVKVYTFTVLFFSSLCFGLLKSGNSNSSAAVLVIYMHTLNFSSSFYYNTPLVGLYALMMFPYFTFFLSPSMRVRGVNAVLCCMQCLRNASKVSEAFKITLTDDQFFQINSLIICSYICLAFLCASGFIQKSIENNIWQVAQSDFEKSQQLTKEVLHAIEAKDAFVSSLSHEIRNPLNSMNGSIEYLLATVRESQSLQVLRNAKLSGQILLNLVNNVLDAAKLRSERMELSNMEMNFEDIIKKVLTINTENLRKSNITAKAWIDTDLPLYLWADPSRLLQILMNLFSNAIKFTTNGGNITLSVFWCQGNLSKSDLLAKMNDSCSANKDLGSAQRINQNDSDVFQEFSFEEGRNRSKNLESVHKIFKNKPDEGLRCLGHYIQTEPWSICRCPFNLHPQQKNCDKRNGKSKESAYLKIQITDTGLGIAEENISRLFTMFGQFHRSIQGGTGLGLWICKQLCQKMGGDIAAYSKVNQGTTFVLYLPVNDGKITEFVQGSTPTHDKISALVVDDYSHNRELHKLLLEREGVEVLLAADGKEAIEKYKTAENLDFIMMDIEMPEMDGFQAVAQIRAWEEEFKKKKVDVYFVSGEYYNEEEVLSKFRSKEILGGLEGIRCLRKPIDMEIIRRCIEKFRTIPVEEENRAREEENNRSSKEIESRPNEKNIELRQRKIY